MDCWRSDFGGTTPPFRGGGGAKNSERVSPDLSPTFSLYLRICPHYWTTLKTMLPYRRGELKDPPRSRQEATGYETLRVNEKK